MDVLLASTQALSLVAAINDAKNIHIGKFAFLKRSVVTDLFVNCIVSSVSKFKALEVRVLKDERKELLKIVYVVFLYQSYNC